MSEEKKVYIIALLGTSPAVFSELLWWLHNRDITIVGCEVWTTTMGNDRLNEALSQYFGEMYKSLPAVGGISVAKGTTNYRRSTENTSVRLEDWEVVILDDGDKDLDDIRTMEDAAIVESCLYDRMHLHGLVYGAKGANLHCFNNTVLRQQ